MEGKNKVIKFTAAISVILLFFVNVGATKKNKYREWLSEVGLIMTDVERAEFKKLKTAKEKENFIKLFWARRDPTPHDEKNEFKDEFYRRLEYVKKAFIYGYKHGLETDQGKLYLCFGKPAKIFDHAPSIQVWVYATQAWMDYPKDHFSVVFGYDGNGFVLDRTRTEARIIRAFYSYPEKVLLYPGLKKVPEFKRILSFSPQSFEGKLISQVESSEEDIKLLPFEIKPMFTKAEDVSTYVTLLVRIEPESGKGKVPEQMTFFARLKSGSNSSDFRMERPLLKEEDYYISQVGFPHLPGKYELFFGFFSPDRQTYSLKKSEIEIPSFWSDELALSSLIASSQVTERGAKKGGEEFDIFSLGRYALRPLFDQEYTSEDFLNVFYYVYNVSVDEEEKCSLLIEFELRKGEKKYRLSPQERVEKISKGAVILEGTKIPLSTLPEGGTYKLRVKVTDKLTGKTASQNLDFSFLQ